MQHHSPTGAVLATLALAAGCATSPADVPPAGVKPVRMARLVDRPAPPCAEDADGGKSCYVYVKAEVDSASGCALTFPARFEVAGTGSPRTVVWVLSGDTDWYSFRFDGIEFKNDPSQQDVLLAPNQWGEKVLVVRDYRKKAGEFGYSLKVSVKRRFGEFSSCDGEAVIVNTG